MAVYLFNKPFTATQAMLFLLEKQRAHNVILHQPQQNQPILSDPLKNTFNVYPSRVAED